MKKLIPLILLALAGNSLFAQDTAFVSRHKFTALFFPAEVSLVSPTGGQYLVREKGNGVVALKAAGSLVNAGKLDLRNATTKEIYHIPIAYSDEKAGRRITYGSVSAGTRYVSNIKNAMQQAAVQLAGGKRDDVVSREKEGGVKAFVGKITLADGKIYLRLDIRNRSALPFEPDFVRFYIREQRTIERTASHEQEIVPTYTYRKTSSPLGKGMETVFVFAFKRFSLGKGEMMDVEIYERHGNRNMYLKIEPKHLENLRVIPARKVISENNEIANRNNNSHDERETQLR